MRVQSPFRFSITALCATVFRLVLLNSEGNASPLIERGFEGEATYYDVGLGSCGNWNSNTEMVVAINIAQAGGGYPQPHCGQQLRITSNGHSEIATVVDTCPGCKYGDLDMSPVLFQHFNDLGVGRFRISWSWESAEETRAPEIISTSSQAPTLPTHSAPVPTSTASPPAPSPSPSASPASTTESAPTSEALPTTSSTRSSAQESSSSLSSDKAGTLATPTTAVATAQSYSRLLSPSTVAEATIIGHADNTHSDESVLLMSNLESLAGGLLNLGRMVIILAQLKEPIDVGF